MNRPDEAVIKALAVTCELMGNEVSTTAARVMAHDLAPYDPGQVMKALERVRKEVRGRLTIADVIERLEDGRPGAEQAWAECPRDEGASVVWCEEQVQAWAVARPLLSEGEFVQARMAFIETYRRLCREAREAGVPPKWGVSLGYDLNGREQAVLRGVELKRFTPAQAAGLLPHTSHENPNGPVAALLAAAGLTTAALPDDQPREFQSLLPDLTTTKGAAA